MKLTKKSSIVSSFLAVIIATFPLTVCALNTPKPPEKHFIDAAGWKKLTDDLKSGCIEEAEDLFDDDTEGFCNCFSTTIVKELKAHKFAYYEDLQTREKDFGQIVVVSSEFCAELVSGTEI